MNPTPAAINEFGPLFKRLAAEQVEFLLIGGVAAWLHGSARSTQDIDLLYRRRESNYAKIARALKPLSPYLRGAPPGLPFDLDEQTIAVGGNFTLTTTQGAIDLLATIAGGDYDSLCPESTPMDLFGVSCRVLNLDTLIRVKRAAGRPKDFEAIAELELILEAQSQGDPWSSR